jgi:catechol 1,2-dioxygenase
MIIRDEQDLTRAVLEELGHVPDARLREVLQAAVRHLHGFVRETRLTEVEFQQACRVVARLGQLTDASHNEVVLTAGSLGISQLVSLLNNASGGRESTSANLMGPFWREGAPVLDNGASLLRGDTAGEPLFVRATVLTPTGEPVAGARVDIWHASAEGLYENQDPSQPDMNLRGTFRTDAAGQAWFTTIKPAPYPVPVEGVAGDLLRAQGRHNMRPAHVHFLVSHPGWKAQFSQVYVQDDPFLHTDAQFGVTAATVGNYVRHEGHPAPDGSTPPVWHSLEHTFTLQPGEPKLPPAPVRGKASERAKVVVIPANAGIQDPHRD